MYLLGIAFPSPTNRSVSFCIVVSCFSALLYHLLLYYLCFLDLTHFSALGGLAFDRHSSGTWCSSGVGSGLSGNGEYASTARTPELGDVRRRMVVLLFLVLLEAAAPGLAPDSILSILL